MFASQHVLLSSQDFTLDTQRNRKIWGILSFQSGWINAGGFLACHRFVTHVTGFATQFGADMARFSWKEAFGMLTVPLFFLAGSMISAFYVDRSLTHNKKGQFHILFFLISFFLLIVTVMGSLGLFGKFGAELDIVADYVLIALLCLSSGIQNAAITTASNSFVRTTHLTGITTDLGVGLVRMFSQKNNEIKKSEKNKNQIRLIILFSFIIGTTLGSIAFTQIQYLGFLIPTFISFFIYLIARKGMTSDA